MQVAICICTFQRQALLRDLLCAIARLSFRKVPTPQLQVIVVDNDASGCARDVCAAMSAPWPSRYVIEQRRGITHARNRAICEAGRADFIAFIDDDESPSPQWLDELLWTQTQFEADVVSGPVFPKYDPEIPEWVRRGGFFDPRVYPTGTARETCACNNVLIGRRVFKSVQGFDDAFALSGAEDTDFFLRVRRAGYKILWSQEAFVSEVIAARRGTVVWILRREYQTGNGWVFCELVNSGVGKRTARFIKASGHILLGSAAAIGWVVLSDKAAVIRGLKRVSLGAGMLAALTGYRFMAYQTPETANATPREPKPNGTAALAETPSVQP